ncbi:unnamed protein product [Lactuca virosa]|uniref:C-JID domain-containing protein n=1 Tax=Lactuca virosa TaxID=75947 RepID=A0AAU9NC62_9ASTR|nr:unnamed protein product [Lactuca virosa]
MSVKISSVPVSSQLHGADFFPKKLGNMKTLEELSLGFNDKGRSEIPVGLHSLTSLSSLKKLNLNWRQIEEKTLPKCVAVNHRLRIAIPGRKIPSWIKQEKDGCRIALKLPHKWHTRMMGFVVCGVFHGSWLSHYASPRITFNIVTDGKMYHDLQPQDWSHIQRYLDITVMLGYVRSLRCGAHVIYKEDVQQITNCISDYGNVVHVDNEDQGYDEVISANTYKCAVGNHGLSITIPGSIIPSWFEKEMDGCRIRMKLPQKWHTEFMGLWYVVCLLTGSRDINSIKSLGFSARDLMGILR